MAIYHFNMHSNKVGNSAVAHAAYISGSQLYNDRTGTTHDYRKKENIVCPTLLFPEGVEPMSREELWNTIEAKIKIEGRNYGKTGDFAIPKEWLETMTDEEIIDIATEFLTENFVKRGHAVDFAFHKKDGNPHIDFFVPQLKFDEEGNFVAPKMKSVFANVYDEKTGKYSYDPEKKSYDRNDPKGTVQYRFPVIDKNTGKQKIRARGNEKLWHKLDIENDSLNSREFLLQLRQSWQDIANKHLEPEHQIDCRTLEAQGTDREPQIHISPFVKVMEEKNPGSSEKFKRNEKIKERNSLKAELENSLRSVRNELSSIKQKTFKFLQDAYENHLERLRAFVQPQKEIKGKVWEPPKEKPKGKVWEPPKNNTKKPPELPWEKKNKKYNKGKDYDDFDR